LAVVRRHRRDGTIHNALGKLDDAVTRDLAAAGYWGLLIDPRYGGSGASFRSYSSFLTRMATISPTVAGLGAVHSLIGPANAVQKFGNDRQRQQWLPAMAAGRRLGIFALTEPGAGSDLTALRSRAARQGDEFSLTGEKLFITNAAAGRIASVVCLINERPAVLVVELPDAEDESFRLKKYGLHALRHTLNRGLVFRDFRVPAANLLTSPRGDGLSLAYHGLNYGRVALCANTAGSLRIMLAGMLSWAGFRRTYGRALAERELVQRRLARLASLIVGCDALAAWGSSLLDAGYRGELECIVAKVFAAEAKKEAAVELVMKTHGGRAFLHGHPFGDHLPDYLVPCIYEGEGELLGLALFKSLVKEHAGRFFEPLGRIAAARKEQGKSGGLGRLWAARGPLARYYAWLARQRLPGRRWRGLSNLAPPFRSHAAYAGDRLSRLRLEISAAVRKHGAKLADRQCRMSEISKRVQALVAMLSVSVYGHGHDDPLVRQAADLLCQDLHRQLTGRWATDRYFRQAASLGAQIVKERFPGMEDIRPAEILAPYEA